MAFSDVDVINLGLGKISSSSIRRINPPSTALERHCATGYLQWRRSELTKRRWVFAMIEDYPMTLTATGTGKRPYQFLLPTNCLSPVRERQNDWIQRGRSLYSASATLTIDLINDATEDNFDPLFTEVLSCRVALECAEFVTQSGSKGQTADERYERAVDEAGKANAFIIGPEDYEQDDTGFPWIIGRAQGL